DLDEKLLPSLDKQFVAFYNTVLKKSPRLHEVGLEGARKIYDAANKAQGPLAELAKTEDHTFTTDDGHQLTARVFVPKGDKPAEGWPLFVWYHGGGFVVGNITSDNTLCSHWAADSGCVVISL